LLALGRQRPGHRHRAFRRHHLLHQFARPRRGGKDEVAIGHRPRHVGKQAGMVQDPPRPAGHGSGLRIGPAVARIDDPHPVQAEIQHRPRRSADILAHLRAHEDEGR
jgi:hypothetical protein